MESIEIIRGKFIGNPNFNSVQDLLQESFDTYTIGAYRSSYITSYLGFLRQIRHNILEYPENPFYQIIKPKDNEEEDKYKQRVDKKWKNLMSNLSDDDKWEKTLQDSLQEGDETNILFLNENDRNNFKFFRQKRNSAVHVKEGTLTASIVQVLWEFMNTYSKKIVVGRGKETFLEMIETMGRFYDVGEIPEDRISEINESFFLLTRYDQMEILKEFYNKYLNREISNAYMKHISQLFNGFFEHDKKYLYQLMNEKTSLALFSTVVINELEISNFELNRKEVDQILNNSLRLSKKIRSFMKNNEENEFSERVSNFLNLLALPYQGHRNLPNNFNEVFSIVVEDGLTYGVLSIDTLNNLKLNQELKDKLICYMLDKVEESYSFSNGYRKVDIDTFSWNDIYIDMYYIIYLSECTLRFPYPEQDRVNTVFERLVKLCKQYVDIANPQRNHGFLTNFNKMMDLLSSHDDLLLKIFE